MTHTIRESHPRPAGLFCLWLSRWAICKIKYFCVYKDKYWRWRRLFARRILWCAQAFWLFSFEWNFTRWLKKLINTRAWDSVSNSINARLDFEDDSSFEFVIKVWPDASEDARTCVFHQKENAHILGWMHEQNILSLALLKSNKNADVPWLSMWYHGQHIYIVKICVCLLSGENNIQCAHTIYIYICIYCSTQFKPNLVRIKKQEFLEDILAKKCSARSLNSKNTQIFIDLGFYFLQ